MIWFKVLLTVLFAVSIGLDLIEADEESIVETWGSMMVEAFLIVGIWLWL